MLNSKIIAITGGTGSFGKRFIENTFKKYNPKKIIIYSRDEYKQYLLKTQFKKYLQKLRFFIGDVRDKNRLYRAFEGVDYIIHAAALKQVPSCEYNPGEAIKTNINGAQNIVDCALDLKIKKIVALSTDKAVNPINLYGATKLCSDKIIINANAYVKVKKTQFSIVRYGNVAGSRGSVIPFFQELKEKGIKEIPITDIKMTRFWITLNEAVELVFKALNESKGGEIYVPKIPSFKIVDLAKALISDCTFKNIGIRPGEKIHEVMITEDDSRTTYEYKNHYIIYPQLDFWNIKENFSENGKLVKDRFKFSSDNNINWLNITNLKKRLKNIK